MITLDISPDVVLAHQDIPLNMLSEPQNDDSEKTIIKRSEEGDILGWAHQRKNPRHTVRFFEGKGGFCAIVTSPKLVYFGLPGSKIVLEDTEVELPGRRIEGKSEALIYPQNVGPQQTLTSQAMILGAGLATRFEPISGNTTSYPKPGVPLYGDQSVIQIIAKHLEHHGFSNILVNTFYKPRHLKQQLTALDNLNISFIDEESPSGTAGGLLKALKNNQVDRRKPIFIIQGDAITDADLSFLAKTHQQRHAAVTIGGQIVPDEDVNKFGIIQTDAMGGDEQSGNIISFKEKPSLSDAGTSRFANAGFYILSPEVYELFIAIGDKQLASGQLYDYAQHFFPAVLDESKKGNLRDSKTNEPMPFWAQAVGGYWSDMGNPTHYIEAVRDIYAGKLACPPIADPSEYYDKDIIYWPGAKSQAQSEGAKLEGNIIVALRP